MTIYIDPDPVVDADPGGPSIFPSAPEGMRRITEYAYPELFSHTWGTNVFETVAVEFYTPVQITVEQLRQVVDQARAQVWPLGWDILGYCLFEQGVGEISVPYRACLFDSDHCFEVPTEVCIPILNICIPVAGQTIVSGLKYRFWLMLKAPDGGGGSGGGGGGAGLTAEARGVVLGAFAILFIVIGVLAGLIVLLGFASVWTGSMTWSDFRSVLTTVLRAPGENVRAPVESASFPFLALGIGVVGVALILPAIATKLSASANLPIGGRGDIRVGGEIGTSGRR